MNTAVWDTQLYPIPRPFFHFVFTTSRVAAVDDLRAALRSGGVCEALRASATGEGHVLGVRGRLDVRIPQGAAAIHAHGGLQGGTKGTEGGTEIRMWGWTKRQEEGWGEGRRYEQKPQERM